MSRVDELILESSPGGVSYCTLGELAEYSKQRVDATEVDGKNFVGVDNLIADKGGRVDATYSPNSARLTAFVPGAVLLGNIRPYSKKAWLAENIASKVTLRRLRSTRT